LIVNYNYERFLPEAIESVLSQGYQHFELIICDDGSKDNSRDVISRFAERDERIRSIFKENAAVAAALNDAFRASTGEIITMLDADDKFLPGKLQRVVERLRPGGRVGMVMDPLVKVDSDGKEIGRIPELGTFERGELREHILRTSGIFSAAPTSGLAMRRECAERVFPVPEGQFRTEADAYMRIVAALYYAVDVIDEPLTVYRVHSSNVTASRTVDTKWCDRVLNTAERIHHVLQEKATEHGWPLAPLSQNAGYCEVLLVRDYLQGASRKDVAMHIQQLNRAAGNVATSDRTKTRLKAAILSSGSLLPRPLRNRLLEAIYLPGGPKRLLSNAIRRG
jgi:glycosyltransferase involved in cell wall biosynthesis